VASPVETIMRKRSGGQHPREELRDFVNGFLGGQVETSQMAAWLMAIFFQGMTDEEIQALTEVYIESGTSIRFPSDMRTVDKHSTGGVGDKVSLPLAAIAVACGARIPMISGRGLGHTGGTLDKLEAIPGFRTGFNEDEFVRMVNEHRLAIISQSEKLVPADKRIYALRDITATVESLPLITASIMSKKIVEGAQNLVIDLKTGSGAFMKTLPQAEELARLLTNVGRRLGQRVSVVFTDMEAPLGKYAGNALEVRESIEYLRGESIPDLDEVTRALVVEMLILIGKARTSEEADDLITEAINSGRALAAFRHFIEVQGGDPQVCDDFSLLPTAPASALITASADGWVESVDSQGIGYALVNIGAGRRKEGDALDYSAGALLPVKIGDRVNCGQSIGEVYAATIELALDAAQRIASSYHIAPKQVRMRNRVLQVWRESTE
jgi:pyrimidine-nucleoside phosphorylase